MTNNSAPTIAHDLTGLPLDQTKLLIVWAHGWGHDRKTFQNYLPPLASQAAHLFIDFPGFGDSPRPSTSWTTADYADAMAAFLKPFRDNHRILWVGHSFGCRVGLQIAARHPDLLNGLFLIAAAGLPRRRSLAQTLKFRGRIALYKTLKFVLILLRVDPRPLRKKFGSKDYKSAGEMRSIFLNVIREDLSNQAKQVKIPTELVYGSEDNDTPPEIGQRLAKLIPHARLHILPGQDHLSVLGQGRAVVLKRLTEFLGSLG